MVIPVPMTKKRERDYGTDEINEKDEILSWVKESRSSRFKAFQEVIDQSTHENFSFISSVP